MNKIVLVGLLAVAPVFAGTKTTDFDVSNQVVNNHIAGGKVEITAVSKIEALTDGDILSESSFFFPAPAEKIAEQLATPDGICKIAAFCKGVKNTGPLADGSGWAGEMTINAEKIAKVAGNGDWVRDMKNATQKHGEYTIKFELRKSQEGPAQVVRFTLLDGKVLSKCDLTIRAFAGGSASTMVVVQSRSNSKLAPTVSDRVSLAKRIVRDSAALLNRAFAN